MQMYIVDERHAQPRRRLRRRASIAHEYGHGISNRLTGGPSSASAASATREQMGEGWSDYFGLMLTMKAERHADHAAAASARTSSTRRRRGVGIRPAPYSPASRSTTTPTSGPRTAAVPHGVGFVWATILWEATWDMIDAYGFSPDLYNAAGTAGNQMMLRLVTEGLKLQPCSPGFVDGRDAILAADALLYPDAANARPWPPLQDALGGLRAARAGARPSQGSSGTNADNTEAFDLPLPPPAASVTATSVTGAAPLGGSVTVPVTVRNTAPDGHAPLRLTATILGGFDARPAVPATRTPGSLRLLPAPDRGKMPETATSAAPAFGAGGPDGFGYAWADSDEPGGPTFGWVDIATTGTAVTLADDAAVSVALPFAFPFYGTDRTSVRVTSNGWLGFAGSGTATGATNAAIPTGGAPNDLIAAFWDDLNPADGGQIRYRDMGDGRFVVSWLAVPRYNEAGSAMTFQAILYATGEIVFQYQTLVGTRTSATVGIENPTGTDGLQVVSDAAYARDGLAVRVSQSTIWATVAPRTATVAPGDSVSVVVTLNATDLAVGTYTAALRLTSNDPDTPSVELPVQFEVGGTTAGAAAAGRDAFALEPVAPNPTRGAARVRFSLPEAQAVRVTVTDLLGREVAVLRDGPAPAGATDAAFPASLPAGTYVVRLAAADGAVATRRVTVVR